MPGPPRKPSAMRELGPPLHRKKNKSEPKPDLLKNPAPPHWLTRKGKAAWRNLAPLLSKLKVLTEADRKTLELLCDAYSEFRENRQVIIDQGPTYTTTTPTGDVMVRPRPEVAMYQDAFKRLFPLMQHFGMTPASRTKISTGEGVKADPAEEFLAKGKKLRAVK